MTWLPLAAPECGWGPLRMPERASAPAATGDARTGRTVNVSGGLYPAAA
jgi:hypothetical protein